ncbi:MAG: serine/threonine-protein kinase [Byssovorax sp.]
MDIEAGTVIAGRYRVLGHLRPEGAGAVYEAERVDDRRKIALKVLRGDLRRAPSSAARLRLEAKTIEAVDSDHLIRGLAYDEDRELGPLLAMEMLEGETLLARLKRGGPLRLADLHPLVEQTLQGLKDLHRAGVIHADIRPQNLFLETCDGPSPRIKILDFASAHLPAERSTGERLAPFECLGTFSFMPPEQIAKAETFDHRADIYACATVIFQALSGRLPFSSRDMLAMVEAKCKTDAPKLGEKARGPVHPEVEAFVALGLARDPEERFQSAAAALAAWRAITP